MEASRVAGLQSAGAMENSKARMRFHGLPQTLLQKSWLMMVNDDNRLIVNVTEAYRSVMPILFQLWAYGMIKVLVIVTFLNSVATPRGSYDIGKCLDSVRLH